MPRPNKHGDVAISQRPAAAASPTTAFHNNNWLTRFMANASSPIQDDLADTRIDDEFSHKGFLAESMKKDGFMLDLSDEEFNAKQLSVNGEVDCDTFNCPCCGIDCPGAVSEYHSHVTQCYLTRVLAFKKQDEIERAARQTETTFNCNSQSPCNEASGEAWKSSSVASSTPHATGHRQEQSVRSTASTTSSESACVTLEQLRQKVAQLGQDQRLQLMQAFKQLSECTQEHSRSTEPAKFTTEKVLSLLYSPAPNPLNSLLTQQQPHSPEHIDLNQQHFTLQAFDSSAFIDEPVQFQCAELDLALQTRTRSITQCEPMRSYSVDSRRQTFGG